MKRVKFNCKNNLLIESATDLNTMLDINDYIERRRSALLDFQQDNKNSSPWVTPVSNPRMSGWPSNNPSHNWATAIKATKGFITLTKRTRRPAAWRVFSEVSVAGVSAALDRKSPLLRRILWSVVLIVCASLMLVQVNDRIQRYREEPVNVNVRITHNDSLEYPAITVCNKNVFNRTQALQLMIKHKLVPADATDSQVNISLLIGMDGLTPERLWNKLAQNRTIFIPECWFGRGATCEEQGEWTLVQTVVGPCYTYRFGESHVNAVGSFHNLFMRMHETTPTHKDDNGVRILVHERRDSPILAVRTSGMSAELGWTREVKLELRKFHILDTMKSPCRDDEYYSETECQLQCFQQVMIAINKCRMPYMTDAMFANVSECSTVSEYEKAMETISSMLHNGGWSANECKCPQACHQTAFQTYPENMAFKTNEIKIKIFYENLVFEQITEEEAYTTISLLCDIGGTLGLLMGASVLTVCEILEVAWSHFLQRCCRLQDRKPPLPSDQPLKISKLPKNKFSRSTHKVINPI